MPKKSKAEPTKTKSFSRMSAAAQRVAIAKDVLHQIKANQYQIQSGTWLDIEKFNRDEARDIKAAGKNFTQALLKGGRVPKVGLVDRRGCECCAVGAACASAIRLFNRAEISGGYIEGMSEANKILGRYFSLAQIDMIEGPFEMRESYEREEAAEDDYARATAFGSKYEDDNKRAIAIFQNIIKNKGTFNP